MNLKETIENIQKDIKEQVGAIKNSGKLKELETKYLGRKGEFTQVLRKLSELTEEERKNIGKRANEIKKELVKMFNDVRDEVSRNENDDEMVDVSLPGSKSQFGHLNPVTQMQNFIEDLFSSMGFMVLDGPELESDFFNFEALNIPKHHPARDMQDTFYINQKNKDGEYDMVMRTHTSPMQVRAMKKYGAPLKAIVPGRVFRSEATDVRHEHTFYQFEGLMIDKDINFSHLKGVLEVLGEKMFGKGTKVRLRPKYYPFVEPGANVEFTCFICGGKGCKLDKYTGWLEVAGSGMVHPNVLRAGGIDPDVYTGFAFGFGLNRLVMLKHGIGDIRTFNSGDMRFLEQF